MPLIYGVGYDSHWEALTLAENLGIIEKSGAWYSYKNENIAQGEEKARAYLKDNPDIYTEVREEIIDLMGLKELYERNS